MILTTYLTGSCRSGRDRVGTVTHSVPSQSGTMGAALCGKVPTGRSAGWSENWTQDKPTCERCRKMLAQDLVKDLRALHTADAGA